MWRISQLDERLLASQEGFCSMELVASCITEINFYV